MAARTRIDGVDHREPLVERPAISSRRRSNGHQRTTRPAVAATRREASPPIPAARNGDRDERPAAPSAHRAQPRTWTCPHHPTRRPPHDPQAHPRRSDDPERHLILRRSGPSDGHVLRLCTGPGSATSRNPRKWVGQDQRMEQHGGQDVRRAKQLTAMASWRPRCYQRVGGPTWPDRQRPAADLRTCRCRRWNAGARRRYHHRRGDPPRRRFGESLLRSRESLQARAAYASSVRHGDDRSP